MFSVDVHNNECWKGHTIHLVSLLSFYMLLSAVLVKVPHPYPYRCHFRLLFAQFSYLICSWSFSSWFWCFRLHLHYLWLDSLVKAISSPRVKIKVYSKLTKTHTSSLFRHDIWKWNCTTMQKDSRKMEFYWFSVDISWQVYKW